MTVRPLAGTRRRGRTPAEDVALAEELLADPKELAEHVMLIDLARNDIGRVAETGTVKVPVRFVVERFSHVMHIVSEVNGRVRTELGPGTSCAPRSRRARSPARPRCAPCKSSASSSRGRAASTAARWAGSAPARDLDFAIAIRTILCQNGRFEITAAAGIVEGSVPALEAKETRNKARAALAAIRAARGK